MGRSITDNFYDFVSNITAIPGNFVGGVSDIVGGGKNMIVELTGVPPKFYNAVIDGGTTIVNTPTSLGNNAQQISENAKDISGNAKDTVDSLKPILIIGALAFAFKTITEFNSGDTSSNLTRIAMLA